MVRYLEGEELTPAIYFLFSRRATEEAASSCLALRPVPHAAALVEEAKSRLADLSLIGQSGYWRRHMREPVRFADSIRALAALGITHYIEMSPQPVLLGMGSEIVTGALRDRHRATVVGTNTFGKGLVQEVENLSNGGYLDLTVANYYLPGGRTIGRNGIKPQVRARDDPSTERDEALPMALDTVLDEQR